jgi:23S rRNA (adenine2503-C2)-methyltransferase
LNSPYGFSLGARHFTISTVGIVPQIKELTNRRLQVGLAVSLHAPDNALRDELVPINKRYPIEQLVAACKEYTAATNRRVTFEYALIDNVNDSREQARALAGLLKGMLCHVNLIPLNAIEGSEFSPSSRDRALAFQAELNRRRIVATMRTGRGAHIDAACGQLKARTVGSTGIEANAASGLLVAATNPNGHEDPVDQLAHLLK